MKVVAAYLLALLGGNPSPSAEDIKAILGSVGAEAEEDRVSYFLGELEGKDINEVICFGREKFASVSGGGGGGVVVSAAASGGGGGGAAAETEAPQEEKKEEKKEPEEESDDVRYGLQLI
ncbi:hypothetical protein O6H91_Y444200 [Diphasiastrum complanatum]|nr:hypothetical protein O6H91_Y444200 [Diphasiastrum complanatum]